MGIRNRAGTSLICASATGAAPRAESTEKTTHFPQSEGSVSVEIRYDFNANPLYI